MADQKKKTAKKTAAKKTAAPKVSDKPNVKIVRLHGLALKIDLDEFANDFEILTWISNGEHNPTAAPSLLYRFLGHVQHAELMTAMRNDRGIVPMDAGYEAVTEILRQLDPKS